MPAAVLQVFVVTSCPLCGVAHVHVLTHLLNLHMLLPRSLLCVLRVVRWLLFQHTIHPPPRAARESRWFHSCGSRSGLRRRCATDGPLLAWAKSEATVVLRGPLRLPGCSPANYVVSSRPSAFAWQLSPLCLAACLVICGHLSTQTRTY